MTFADFFTKLRWIGKKTDCDDSTVVFIAMVVEKEALFFLRRPVQKKPRPEMPSCQELILLWRQKPGSVKTQLLP